MADDANKLIENKMLCICKCKEKQEGQRCLKRRVAQAAIRLATAVITFRNKERNVRSPSKGECVRLAKKCKTCNLGYIIVSML